MAPARKRSVYTSACSSQGISLPRNKLVGLQKRVISAQKTSVPSYRLTMSRTRSRSTMSRCNVTYVSSNQSITAPPYMAKLRLETDFRESKQLAKIALVITGGASSLLSAKTTPKSLVPLKKNRVCIAAFQWCGHGSRKSAAKLQVACDVSGCVIPTIQSTVIS